MVYGDWGFIDEAGRPVDPPYQPGPWNLTRAVSTAHAIGGQPASFIRRRALERVGWLDASFRQCKDYEVWLRIGLGGVIAYTPMLLAYARNTPGISHQGHEVAEGYVRAIRKFFALPGLPPAFQEKRFQQRAWSNAHLRWGLYALRRGMHVRFFLRYFAKAFAVAPFNTPFLLKILLWETASSLWRRLLPRSTRLFLRRYLPYKGPPW